MRSESRLYSTPRLRPSITTVLTAKPFHFSSFTRHLASLQPQFHRSKTAPNCSQRRLTTPTVGQNKKLFRKTAPCRFGSTMSNYDQIGLKNLNGSHPSHRVPNPIPSAS